MTKIRRDIEIGVKYSGYGVLNEFGEWTFIPSQVGSRAGKKKFVCGDNDYTIYTTAKKIIIHATILRGERFPIIQAFLKIVDRLLSVLKDYDFRCILPTENKGR